MLNWVRNLLSRVVPAVPVEVVRQEPLSVRRWDSAKTHRLNSAHWSAVTGNPINTDLQSYLATLRTRCQFEAANNPHVEGVIATHQIDLIGPDGPTLQVISSNEAYNEAVESLWKNWWRRPILGRRQSGAEWLRLCVRDLWLCGELLAQKVYPKSALGPIRLRVKPIHPYRLDTPAERAGQSDVALGIKRNADGEPVAYMIAEPMQFGSSTVSIGRYQELPADQVIHEFLSMEADQIRGVPWLAASLDAIADLRNYDQSVLKAARRAASMGVYWYTEHPDAEYIEVDESIEVEEDMETTGPPGWKPAMIPPQQPSSQYKDFRGERLGEIGRPVGMPKNLVRLDSQGLSFSAAQLDHQLYVRSLKSLQDFLGRGVLSPLVDDVSDEGALDEIRRLGSRAGAIARRPDDVHYSWGWTVPQPVDLLKHAKAEATGLRIGTLSLTTALALRGKDLETHIEELKRERQLLCELEEKPVASEDAEETEEESADV